MVINIQDSDKDICFTLIFALFLFLNWQTYHLQLNTTASVLPLVDWTVIKSNHKDAIIEQEI